MGIEDLALRNIEREEQYKKREFVSKIGHMALASSDGPERIFRRLKENVWGDVWDDRKLRYVARSEFSYLTKFEHSENVKNAEVLETLTNVGISRLRWLGNFLNQENKAEFRAFSSATRPFDDVKHRIDSVATILLGSNLRAKYPAVGDRIQIGIDATTWKRDERLQEEVAKQEASRYFAEKISRSNNEDERFQTPAPFGFSQLDFYISPWKDQKTGVRAKSKIGLLPRFVIGVDGELADSIRQYDFKQDEGNGRYVPKDDDIIMNDPRTVTTQFKVLSEIHAQSGMLIKMMPQDYAKKKEFVLAMEQLELIEDITSKALKSSANRVVEVMLGVGILPKDVQQSIRERETDSVEILEEMFCDSTRKENPYWYDPTYEGIMSATRDFTDYASSDTDEGKELRTAKARNKAVVVQNGKIKDLSYKK